MIIDPPALVVALLIPLAITVVLMRAHRDGNTRAGWIAAGILAAALALVGFADISRSTLERPPIAGVVVGATLPVLGALGMIRATRRVRSWARWALTYTTAIVLLFAGLLIGATLVAELFS